MFCLCVGIVRRRRGRGRVVDLDLGMLVVNRGARKRVVSRCVHLLGDGRDTGRIDADGALQEGEVVV